MKVFRNSKVVLILMLAVLLLALGTSNVLPANQRPNRKILFLPQPPVPRIRDCLMF